MLTKPDLQDQHIAACLQDHYRLRVTELGFLPKGADQQAAVYRAVSGGRAYFVKLRRGALNRTALALARFLSERGLESIIAPLATQTGQLWANLGAYTLVLYPFIEGHNGYEAELSESHWVQLGRALGRLHALELPHALKKSIPPETYTPYWRERVRGFLAGLEGAVPGDPVAAELVAFLQDRRDEVLELIERAEQLVLSLRAQSPELVLCHADIHAGNVLLGPGGALYIVDWDNPVLAPRERDLMFVGAGLWGNRRPPQEEEALFYQGYGSTQTDPLALAYFRYERIIQDIAAFYEEILQAEASLEDKEQSLRYLKSNFLPGNTIELAYRSDPTLKRG